MRSLLKGHQLQFDPRHCRFTWQSNADINRYILASPIWLSETEIQSSPSSGPLKHAFELDCNYYLRIFYKNIN